MTINRLQKFLVVTAITMSKIQHFMSKSGSGDEDGEKIGTIAVISSKPCRYSTILDLWDGSTRAKQRACVTASR